MRKKTLVLIIVLMSLSLVGLISFQGYWIHHAVQMEEQIFDRNVNDALHQVVRTMETKEAIQFLKEEAPQLRAAALSSVVTPVPAMPEKSAVQKALPKKEPVTTKTPSPDGDAKLNKIIISASTADREGNNTKLPLSATGSGIKIKLEGRSKNNENGLGRADQLIIYPQKEKKEKFGNSPLDSVVIWRLLAAHSKNLGSTSGKEADPLVALRRKMDSTAYIKINLDTLPKQKQLELLHQMPVNSIQSMRMEGGVVNIYTNTPDSSFVIRRPSKTNFTSQDSTVRSVTVISRNAKNQLALIINKRKHEKELENLQSAKAPMSVEYVNKELAIAQKAKAKVQQLNQVMEKMAAEYVRKEKPLRQRLRDLDMQDLLNLELSNRNILPPYHIELQTKEAQDFVLATHNSAPTQLAGSYQTQLFPNDVLTTPSFLLLNFPNRQAVIWQKLVVPTLISGLFTLIILVTFYFTLSTILRQKKISEIKNDFINNMTHEFKTPIATISLALDALVNPKVREDKVRVDYYAGIIKDENRRMHQQVEKVLQTAQIERNKLQLAVEPIDVHQLIKKAAEPFQLHVEKRQGTLSLKLEAAQPVVWADPGHLATVLGNLLDNANKYSPNRPNIAVQTAMNFKGLQISVEDQGVGMTKESQKRIFEKFYRVPTGNVHNIKGFGLGLSYVKDIIEAHGGEIQLRSSLGHGSKFTVWLPIQKAQS